MNEKLLDTYPVVVVQDRYTGVYSGGTWLAVSRADLPYEGQSRVDFVLNGGPHRDDRTAAEFWSEPPDWIAVGNSPQEAVDRLLCRIN